MPTIIDYQPTWPAEFAAIAATLRRALGDLALRIDHIGSTSVPGLAAKDIIDVQIAVAALTPEVLAPLTALGYTRSERIVGDHRPPNSTGPDSDWEKWFLREPQGQRMTNTHVRVLGRPNQRYPILFRDYLRAHPATAAAYAELKAPPRPRARRPHDLPRRQRPRRRPHLLRRRRLGRHHPLAHGPL